MKAFKSAYMKTIWVSGISQVSEYSDISNSSKVSAFCWASRASIVSTSHRQPRASHASRASIILAASDASNFSSDLLNSAISSEFSRS